MDNITSELNNLKPKQRQAIRLLVDYDNAMTYEEIASEVGVSARTLWAWRNKDEDFIAAKTKLAEEGLIKYIDKVNKALVKNAMEGNSRHIEIFYKRLGKLKDKLELTGEDGGPIEIDAKAELERAISRIAERKENRGNKQS